MNKKNYTTKDVLATIKAIAEAQNPDFEMDGVTIQNIIEYCDKTVDAIDKKNEKARERNAKKRAEKDAIQGDILAVMTDELQTREQITEALDNPELTVNMVGAKITKLVQAGTVVKEKTKNEGGRTVMGYKLSPATDAE